VTDSTLNVQQHFADASFQVQRGSFADLERVDDGNELVADDGSLSCARCDQVIAAGQPIRRRASGGWAHENC
jgi:hypothetical protein